MQGCLTVAVDNWANLRDGRDLASVVNGLLLAGRHQLPPQQDDSSP
jgi:hypothetical protein